MTTETRKWLEEKYVEWRNKQPRRKDGVVQFAAYVGVSRNTMTNWLNRVELRRYGVKHSAPGPLTRHIRGRCLYR